MNKVFSFDPEGIVSILIASVVIYVLLILSTRIFGKRSTSEFNSFDWIVTVSAGSLVASTVILKNVSLLEGCASLFFLLTMQYLTTKIVQNIDLGVR